ncbi:hypothetical protein cypCar_00044074 [Cyprinus carpio]|nr:hypothetical protein cypCar_00044074 [Cyprinus carpio]
MLTIESLICLVQASYATDRGSIWPRFVSKEVKVSWVESHRQSLVAQTLISESQRRAAGGDTVTELDEGKQICTDLAHKGLNGCCCPAVSTCIKGESQISLCHQ